MLDTFSILSGGLTALILGLMSNGTDTQSVTEPQVEPIRCEIQTLERGGQLTLKGVVLSEQKIDGSYQFSVSNKGRNGSSNIQQGGEFFATANKSAVIGKVVLNASGASYDAQLSIRVDGETYDCFEQSDIKI